MLEGHTITNTRAAQAQQGSSSSLGALLQAEIAAKTE